MPPDFSQIGPFLLALVVVFAVYRRLRRSFGRQPLRPRRMTVRMVLLAVLLCALLPMALRSAQFLTAELAGAALGLGLGVWGAQRTRFVRHGGALYYVPHTYTGIAVSLLFLGRLVFRLVQLYANGQTWHAVNPANAANAAHANAAHAPPAMVSSPLTVGVFFVLGGYYLWYYGWVLWKSKHLEPAEVEEESTVAAP
jgi:hypothetical protein